VNLFKNNILKGKCYFLSLHETDYTTYDIVFDLYGLEEEEVATVLDSLNTDEEEKVGIMGKFREF